MSNSIKIGLLNLRLQFLGQSYPNYLKTLNWGICPNFCITSQVFKQPCYHNKLTSCSRCLGCTFWTPNNADAGNPKQNHKWSQHGRRQKQPNLSSIVPRKSNLLHSPILSLFLCRMEHSISSFLIQLCSEHCNEIWFHYHPCQCIPHSQHLMCKKNIHVTFGSLVNKLHLLYPGFFLLLMEESFSAYAFMILNIISDRSAVSWRTLLLQFIHL